jgi:hypothetical protein
MATESNIFQSFPWYTDPKFQNYKKTQCLKECAYKLITAANALPPFQILRSPTGDPIISFKICCADGSGCIEVNLSDDRYFDIFEDECGREFVTYNGAAFPFTLPCGYHVGIISDGTNTWYSELFYVPDDTSNILPICYLTDHLYNLITTHDTSEPIETC